MVMGSHIEDSLCKKILNNEYVDFSRLLPHDRVNLEEDQRMELVNRNGMSYWTPVSECEAETITSFSKWEMVFWVFANIYTSKFSSKASELLQYSHVIHTASQTYVWDNVYLYDKEFRMHLSKHPQRSWSVILQHAWNLCLKDKLHHDNFLDKGKCKSKEICKRFNRGKCHAGMSCNYDHRCLGCGKFGHGLHICRNRDKSKQGSQQLENSTPELKRTDPGTSMN